MSSKILLLVFPSRMDPENPNMLVRYHMSMLSLRSPCVLANFRLGSKLDSNACFSLFAADSRHQSLKMPPPIWLPSPCRLVSKERERGASLVVRLRPFPYQ